MTERPKTLPGAMLKSLAQFVLQGDPRASAPVPDLPRKGKRTKNRIIRVIRRNGREHYLHATKGWKSRRL